MITPSDISAKTTHDLWIDARQFTINMTRPTPTTLEIHVKRPAILQVTDGAVVLLSTNPISQENYPQDGERYEANTTWGEPAADSAAYIHGAQVVAAYYGILGKPFPPVESTQNVATVTGYPSTMMEFTITVENTDPTTIYYASVHASSNVLQYYPLGVHSYPLEGDENQKTVSGAYTGNIPSYPQAPTAPTPGMVYHDQQLNLIQYYDGESQSWIPTRSDSIVSGPYNPGILGQVYLYANNQLMVFDGKKWVEAKDTNMKVRAPLDPLGWRPLARIHAQILEPQYPQTGEMFYNYTTERIQYYDGTKWVQPTSSNVLFNPGTGDVPAFVAPMTLEPEKLRDPYIGQLFYNTTHKQLNAWNGVSWNKVNTDQVGAPTTDKIAIGKDGSYDERIALIKVLNSQMGWPQMCVELQEEQFNIAIDNALDNYRMWSSGAYKRGFILYKLIPNQQLYYLNSAIDKTDHIVDIHKIHRMGPLGVYGGGPNDVWAQAFAQQYYDLAAGGGDLLSTHLVAAYGEELKRMFAGDLVFQWDEASHELYIPRAIRGYETVVIEAMLERSEQEILLDRWAKQFIQNWSLAELKMNLGLIRSKFSSGTPGAQGTINLNGELLISEARQDMIELKEELLNYEYGGHIGLGNVSFLIG